MKTGIQIIAQERQRQIDEYGYTDEYIQNTNEDYELGELALAAACYCEPFLKEKFFPWPDEFFKPSPENRIKELAKAGAMILAEIDRINSLKS